MTFQLSTVGHVVSKGRVILNHEFETMLNKAVVAHFKVISQHLPRVSVENHDKPHDSWSSGPDSNQGMSDYEARVITTRLGRLVGFYCCRSSLVLEDSWNIVADGNKLVGPVCLRCFRKCCRYYTRP
jgi:hypothetical protein